MTYSPNKLQIELHVEDFDPIKKYYGKLGFEIVWLREPDGDKGYMILQQGGGYSMFLEWDRECL